MRVDYLGLEAFVAVADLGSFSRAAQKLNLTQTALSHRLRKIEEDLGTRLLLRSPREVTLTQAGQELLPKVRAQLDLLAGLYGAMRDSGRAGRARVDLACLPTIAGQYLPAVLRQFADRHPAVRVAVQDLPAARVLDLVLQGTVEFGVTIGGASPWDLDVDPLFTEPYVLLVPRGHRLADRPGVTSTDLLGETPVRIRTQTTNRALVEGALGEALARELDWRFEVQNAAVAMAMVAEGVALTVLPRMAMFQWPDRITGLPFTDVDLSRKIVTIQRRGVPLSPPAEALRTLIRARLADP
ncbi:MAG: LysR family transcriptional regulator [Rhodobacterales bacterium]|nr:LysR family transcriptional regulator [Rhodobacterales bacterium]